MVQEPGPAEGKRSVVGFYPHLETKLPELPDGRETRLELMEQFPSQQGTRLTRTVPLKAWIPWIQTGFPQILRKEPSKKVKHQAGRGRLVARMSSPCTVLFSSHLQSCTGDIRAAPVLPSQIKKLVSSVQRAEVVIGPCSHHRVKLAE